MDKELYLKKLSRAARWHLAPREAAEVIADYRELLADSGGEGDFGDPVQAVRLLERPREYRRWLAVFLLLAVIALAAPLSGLQNLAFELGIFVFLPVLYSLSGFFNYNQSLLVWLPLLGMGLALTWFRRRDAETAERPPLRRLVPLLMVQTLCMAAAWGVFWMVAAYISMPIGLMEFLGTHASIYRAIGLFLPLGGLLCGALGVGGLIRARTENRRWLAAYVWGLAAAGMCTAVLMLLGSMDLSFSVAGWWRPFAARYAVLTAAGLLGTGWALC